MRVLLVNTFEKSGGAAVAMSRLARVLEHAGIEVKILTFYPEPGVRDIVGSKIVNKALFILERILVLLKIGERKWLFKYSPAAFGRYIHLRREVIESDIVHLHWVNFGFLNVGGIGELLKRKTVVWTLHDMWAFTGGCHYAMDCLGYKAACENCFYLNENSKLAQKTLAKKRAQWPVDRLNFIACSNWLGEQCRQSSLGQNSRIHVIGNAIDSTTFRPIDSVVVEGFDKLDTKFYVLFGAVDLQDDRKGFKHLIQALDGLKDEFPNLHLLTFGKMNLDLMPNVTYTSFGPISDLNKLNKLYNLADVFVLPSVQDNLPNTVMESMAAGTPVISFDCGGVRDMIDHLQNGYLAEVGNAEDLAKGIRYFTDRPTRLTAGTLAHRKIMSNYDGHDIASKHISLYQQLVDNDL